MFRKTAASLIGIGLVLFIFCFARYQMSGTLIGEYNLGLGKKSTHPINLYQTMNTLRAFIKISYNGKIRDYHHTLLNYHLRLVEEPAITLWEDTGEIWTKKDTDGNNNVATASIVSEIKPFDLSHDGVYILELDSQPGNITITSVQLILKQNTVAFNYFVFVAGIIFILSGVGCAAIAHFTNEKM